MARKEAGEIRERSVQANFRIEVYRRYFGFRVECEVCGDLEPSPANASQKEPALFNHLTIARKSGRDHLHRHFQKPVAID